MSKDAIMSAGEISPEPFTGAEPTPEEVLCQTAAERIRSQMDRTIASIVEIGTALIEVKKTLPHGKYLAWLSSEFTWTARTAQNFVNVAEHIGSNAKHVSHLPVGTVYKLASRTTSRDWLSSLFNRAENGKRITNAEVQSYLQEESRLRASNRRDRKKHYESEEEEQMQWDREHQACLSARTSIRLMLLNALDKDMIGQLKDLLKIAGAISLADLS